MAENGREMSLDGYEILLCVTGGIACYKSADLASKLVQAGAGVSVAMTDASQQFITPLTFQTLTRRRVFTSLWQASEDYSSQHISLTEQADLMILAPATANVMAKMACGIADDLVSTLALSSGGSCPILAVPAMNDRMLAAEATQQNMETLRSRGVHLMSPAEGYLACGTIGAGRMQEPMEILGSAAGLLLRHPPKSQIV